MYGMYFSFVLFCIAIYCNLLWWRDYYYHFFTYIHVLFSINVFKRKNFKFVNPPSFWSTGLALEVAPPPIGTDQSRSDKVSFYYSN